VLNFSKINTLIIYFIFFLITAFVFLNFQKKDNLYIDKKINLGLDLQGGSYLLLEINSDILIQEKIQDKVIPIKKLLKKNNINYSNFKIVNQSLFVNINNLDKFDLLFNSRKDNLVIKKFLMSRSKSHFQNLDFSQLIIRLSNNLLKLLEEE
jgi:preprotein translocase subunit SecD